MPAERNLVKIIFQNIINSFKPRTHTGAQVGTDYFGNKYFEEPADPSRGRRHPRRWIQTVSDRFDQEMPAEWDAWLRKRRAEPPSDEEVLKNKAIMEMKKVNAAKLAAERGEPILTQEEPKTSFPVYEEYETEPGEKRWKDTS